MDTWTPADIDYWSCEGMYPEETDDVSPEVEAIRPLQRLLLVLPTAKSGITDSAQDLDLKLSSEQKSVSESDVFLTAVKATRLTDTLPFKERL